MGKKLPDHIDGLFQYLSYPKEKANEDLILKYFRKAFGEDFTRQKEAMQADGYVPGHFVLELKWRPSDWLAGLFQGIAYQRELDFSIVVVGSRRFLSIWRVDDIDESIREVILTSADAPNTIAKKMANKFKADGPTFFNKALWKIKESLFDELFSMEPNDLINEVQSFEKTIREQKRVRRKITTKNFVYLLKEMIPFFEPEHPIKTVRAFYSMVFGWNQDSQLALSQKVKTRATLNGEVIDNLNPGKRIKFKSFVDNHYVYLNDNENIDDFFAHYDKALDVVDPNFRKRHGIYFTDLNLSKFVLWYVRRELRDIDIGKNYLVIDPACGSGNLVTNWKSPLELRHKVVSEIEPELLYAVEKRMKGDSWHNGRFTVVPKVIENKGLNFLDKSAEDYIRILRSYLIEKGHNPDKPIAFLCNPPYRSDDDQVADAIRYQVHQSIINLTGKDASAERYCCFLAQMKLICTAAKESGLPGDSFLLLFTKAAWLTKRPIFEDIRREICTVFDDMGGIIINGKEFFSISGKFPVAFSIWKYVGKRLQLNPYRPIPLIDLTWLTRKQLESIDWKNQENTDNECDKLFNDRRSNQVFIGVDRLGIKEWSGLKRNDFQREKRKHEKLDPDFKCGLPAGDQRHKRKKTLGEADGNSIGFLDDLTPCRISAAEPGKPWFYLDSRFMRVRTLRCFSGPPDNRGFCAYNLEAAEKLFLWYALGKTFSYLGYPMWVDAEELWPINPSSALKTRLTKLAFSIGFADNECVNTVFPANNPISGAKEVFISNPLSPIDKNSFWALYMAPFFEVGGSNPEDDLVVSVKRIFDLWDNKFKNEYELCVDYKRPYFVENKVLLKTAGIIQIRDYAKEYQDQILINAFAETKENLNKTKMEFYKLLMSKTGLNYFGTSREGLSKYIKDFVPRTKFDQILNCRLSLASTIVREMANDPNLGRVKFAKVFYMADQSITKDLKTEYYREAAGPLDPRALYNDKIGIESLARRYGHFVADEKKKDQRYRVKYLIGPKIQNKVKDAEVLFGDEYCRIKKTIAFMIPLNTQQSEIVATLFACWNDLILANKPSNDPDIISEFYENWHDNKKRFARTRLNKALKWMREKGFVPSGKKRKTLKKLNPNQTK